MPQGDEIVDTLKRADRFRRMLQKRKAGLKNVGFPWYPHDPINNVFVLSRLLERIPETLSDLVGDEPVLDLGCADGELSFFLETLGYTADAVDSPRTNFNGMEGVRALHDLLRSSVQIHPVDLDAPFILPRARYGVVFFLGVLYHVKNPFYVLETLARYSRYCFLTTRIARLTPDKSVRIQSLPVAYLLEERECNNDPTNYWIFSEVGLRRLLHRTGWDVYALIHSGNTHDSDPATAEGDERAVCLLRSRTADPLACAVETGGWHDLEEGSWRWTERRFFAVLPVVQPAGAKRLELRFVLPEIVLASVGPVTVRATVNDRPLAAETYPAPGSYSYVRSIPADAIWSDTARIGFELDRALPPTPRDRRELGLVVSGLELISGTSERS